jgi:hypothetical protein
MLIFRGEIQERALYDKVPELCLTNILSDIGLLEKLKYDIKICLTFCN